MKRQLPGAVLILSFVLSVAACATEHCTFSDASIMEDRYASNKAIQVHHWFSDTLEVKGVLTSGYLFSVKHWVCDHFGKHAVLILGPNMLMIPENVYDQVMVLAGLALTDSEQQTLMAVLQKDSLSISRLPLMLSIPSKTFDEFSLRIAIVNEVIVIEIRLYQS